MDLNDATRLWLAHGVFRPLVERLLNRIDGTLFQDMDVGWRLGSTGRVERAPVWTAAEVVAETVAVGDLGDIAARQAFFAEEEQTTQHDIDSGEEFACER